MSEASCGDGLHSPIEELRGVGKRRGGVLREAGIATVGDLLLKVPRRYVDRSEIRPIADLSLGESVTVIGKVTSRTSPGFRRGRRPSPITVEVADETGVLRCVWFQGGQYVKVEIGDAVALSGTIEIYRGRRQMPHPECEFLSEGGSDLIHTGRIVPLYTNPTDIKERGLRNRGFRSLVRHALECFIEDIPEPYDDKMRERNGLIGFRNALQAIHFPKSFEQLNDAKKRLAFDELFRLQTQLLAQKQANISYDVINKIKISKKLVPSLLSSLQFSFTTAQFRAFQEIGDDLASGRPMRRLLHGEVGSGKTLVALCAMLAAVECGCQTVIIAPTEILAEQHFHYLSSLLSPFAIQPVLLTGGQRKAVRTEILTALQTGSASVIVGTHALMEPNIRFANLGLMVVDEQHRFGVSQRARLYDKEPTAHVLVMTATPIPRSLALTLYGDLDVSVLDEVPPGRKPVRTELRRPSRRSKILEFVASRIRAGERAYIVYPAIEASENADVKAAEDAYEELRSGVLAGFEIGLLHGRLPSEKKAATMEKFATGDLQVLVATTVIEVGVDVPEATVMVIEHAERFGLAQLHQLRGRVGRGGEQSYCILIDYGQSVNDGESHAPTRAVRRLRAFCNTEDGFEIARQDLEIRGPGELLGTKQAGLPPFKVADPVRDLPLMVKAREEAVRVFADHESKLIEEM